MSISRYVLRSDAVAVGPEGVDVEIGLPWYRSLPWASLAAVSLTVGGREVDLSRARIDGCRLDELDAREDYWHTQYRPKIHVDGAHVGRPGDPRVIELSMRLLIPGPLLADGSPMPYDFSTSAEVVLTEK